MYRRLAEVLAASTARGVRARKLSRGKAFAGRVIALIVVAGVVGTVAGIGSARPGAALDSARNQTLVMARVGVPMVPSANPLLSSTAKDAGLAQGVFEELFYFDWMSGRVEPWLATGYTYNANYTSVTINLRQGVRWSDGKPFTSTDVTYTLRLLKKYPTLLNATTIQGEVKSVSSQGPYRVQIELNKSDRRFVGSVLAGYIADGVFIVPEHIFRHQFAPKFTFFDIKKGWPVGTGPYRLTSWDSTRAVYERRQDWWAARSGFHKLPAPKYLEYETQGSGDIMLEKIASDQLDSTTAQNGLSAWQSVQNKSPYLATWSPTGFLDPCPISLEINTTVKPWDDPQMRWAVSYAIDKSKFSALFSQGPAYVTPFFFPDFPRLRQVIKDNAAVFKKYPSTLYSLDKSAQILSSRGYHKSGGRWVDSNGKPLTINLTVFSPTVAAAWGVAREVLTQQLQDAGFTVQSQALDFGGMFAALRPGNFSMITWFECGSVSEPWQTLARYVNTDLAPIGQNNPTQNMARWNNQQYTNIVNQLQALPGFSAQAKKLTTQALTIFMRDLPVMELTQAEKSIVFSSRHWANWPTAKTPYFQLAPQLGGFHQVILALKPAG